MADAVGSEEGRACGRGSPGAYTSLSICEARMMGRSGIAGMRTMRVWMRPCVKVGLLALTLAAGGAGIWAQGAVALTLATAAALKYHDFFYAGGAPRSAIVFS